MSKMKQVLLLAALACLQVQSTPLEGPMVAFMCNKPAMYFREGVWLPDESVDCLQSGAEILDFCKRMYPDLDIRNIMETQDQVTIKNWCRAGETKCHHHTHKVTPYKCMEGAFESEALLVPEHCIFDHIYGDRACKTFPQWGEEASTSCERDRDPSMTLASHAILTPCEEEVGKFRGVEYVCCPQASSQESSEESEEWSDEDSDSDSESYEEGEDEDEDDDEDSEEDEDEEDEEDSEEDSDLGIDADLDVDMTLPKVSSENNDAEMESVYEQYLHNVGGQGIDEHEYFLKAKSDLQKRYHEKVTMMMKQWALARQHVQDVKENDPKSADALNKDITSRFQKTYEALEQEGVAEKKQLVTLHLQRVEAFLNENKRQAFEKYLDVINEAQPDPTRILKVLKHYIRSEEKDKMHTLNHYKHVRDMDPAEADRQREQCLEHIKIIDDRIQQSKQMLTRIPQYQKKIELQIDDFLKTFHEIDTGINNIIRVKPVKEKEPTGEDIVNQYKEEEKELADKETEEKPLVDIPEIIHVPLNKDVPGLSASSFDDLGEDEDDLEEQRENEHDLPENHVAHLQQNQAEVQHLGYIKQERVNSAKDMPAGGALGIAVGGITVFVIIVVGIVVLRRRANSMRSTTGFVEVDQATSPEEKHVANMQINGYENPTYRYFEMSSGTQNA